MIGAPMSDHGLTPFDETPKQMVRSTIACREKNTMWKFNP